MSDTSLPALREAVAKIAPCPKCSGAGFLVTNSSHAEHDAGCDGSCRNCPVEVPDQDIGPCDCEFAQANLTEADLWRLASALPALLDELEAARANYSDIAELLFGEAEYEHDDVRLRVVAILDELEALKARTCATCRRRWPREGGLDLCGKASIYGHSVAQVACQQMGNTCGAWAAKEPL